MANYCMKSSIIFLFAVLFIFQSCAQQPQKGGLGGLLEKAGQVLNNTTGGVLPMMKSSKVLKKPYK
jgi:hypothetical protein